MVRRKRTECGWICGVASSASYSVVEAAEPKIVYADDYFELFGLDIMIAVRERCNSDAHNGDSSSSDLCCTAYLLEVNSSPTFVGIHVPGLADRMMIDLMAIIIDERDSPLAPQFTVKPIRQPKPQLVITASYRIIR
jgi:hypothetical protein